MKRVKRIGLFTLVAILLIQAIRPARNINNEILPSDLAQTHPVPDKVLACLRVSCYDCHSNNTAYPWYARIEPVGWLMARHIRRGKAQLNFSMFGSYPRRRQISKLKGMENTLKDGTMPLTSYLLMHPRARLSKQDKAAIIDWLQHTRDSLESNN